MMDTVPKSSQLAQTSPNTGKKLISGGYVLKPRCIRDSVVYNAAPCTREVWDYLTREANHTDNKSSGRLFTRGQLMRSYEQIREDLHWYEGWCKKTYTTEQIRTAFDFLRKHQLIHTEKTTRGLIITVLNYDLYQNPANYTDTATEPAGSPQRSPHRKVAKMPTPQSKEEASNTTEPTPEPAGSPQPPHTINNNDNNEINIYSEERREGFIKFQDWIKKNTPSVAEMQEPFTIAQYAKLKESMPYSKIIDILEQMEYWEGLAKRKSAYKTFMTFYKRSKTPYEKK